MAKENKKLLKLKEDLKVVKHIQTKKMGVGIMSLFRKKIRRRELLCQYREPQERRHFLKCKKWDYKDLIEKVPKCNKNNPELYLIGKGTKEFGF